MACKEYKDTNVNDQFPLLNLGTAERPLYYPSEYVTIMPGQVAKVKLLGEETRNMVEFACRSPYANAFSITTDGRDVLGLDEPALARFGVSVDKQMLTVSGRVLQPPQVAYAGGKCMTVSLASWNMINVKVVKSGAAIRRWTYMNIPSGHGRTGQDVADHGMILRFAEFMIKTGVNMSPTPVRSQKGHQLSHYGAMEGQLEQVFNWCKSENIQFVLFLITDKVTDLYNRIKMLGDCTYGIHTSCGLIKHYIKGSPGYFANVALKWNLKMGGVNHRLGEELDLIKQSKTMVVGYDVTHPTNMGTKSDNIPSLVGVVSSVDSALGQWPAISWEQESKKEMLDQKLTDAFKSRLDLWQKHNMQKLPENIVIFRDGVSEGQFAKVLADELPLIRAACAAKCKVSPRISIIVSVKRHHTRFYPTADSGELPENRNISNGTVVDRGVTQATSWDFFLTAHNAIKGTARPAHYTVLLDEVFRTKYGKDAANQLEKFTHGLCYLYGRATKAVSICPPAYYADIVCTRARAHRPEYDASDVESQAEAVGANHTSGSKEVHPALRDTMYYI